MTRTHVRVYARVHTPRRSFTRSLTHSLARSLLVPVQVNRKIAMENLISFAAENPNLQYVS